MTVQPGDPIHGILDLDQGLRRFSLERRAPGPVTAPWVEAYWEVTWDLPPGQNYRQTNLSHATVNVVVEPDGWWLYGVPGPTFVRELHGRGRAFGIKFLTGAFFPWWGRPVRPLFDRRVPGTDLWGTEGQVWASAVSAEVRFEDQVSLTEQFLQNRLPARPGEGFRCARVLIEDRSLVKVDDACRRLGHDARSLQRLFSQQVGVGPKEVLRRHRLMEAAERLVKTPELPGADLAASLGYADQAHFIRDFKAVTGVPPEAYRRRQNPGSTSRYSPG